MPKICKHCFVSGLVQEVFYRANAKEKALELEVTGWVRNTADGRVEVFACGEEEQVNKLEAWLHHGSSRADVTSVTAESVKYKHFADFEVI